MSLRVFASPLNADHLTPPGHPERVERWDAMRRAVLACAPVCGPAIEARLAGEEDLAAVHDPSYIALIRETAGRAVALDPDTFTSPRSYDAARAASGAALAAVEHVIDAPGPARAVAVVRPPGHHAEQARAMGFCLFNNIAIAAARARARGLARVAIVDVDVHHGNGTQHTFERDPSVLFVSTHQFPFYPGTGRASEVGTGPGTGFTVNVPLAAGATDLDYTLVLERVVEPVLAQFAPELVLVSLGFDAHADDPLGGMRLTTAQFGRFAARLRAVADAHARGRIVFVVEGGYDLDAVTDSLTAVLRALADDAGPLPPPAAGGRPARGETALAAVVPELRPYWRLEPLP